MTYLQAINEVLARLRESSVSTITQTTYSTLIGHLINDTKRQVEDAWYWEAQNTTLTLATVSGTSTYTLTGSGLKQKDISVNNASSTAQSRLRPVSLKWIKDQQQLSTNTNEPPSCYAWNGSDGTDSKIELYSTPDAIYSLKFNLNVPQVALTAASDVIIVPSELVVLGAYARALAERGEDGALSSSEAYALYRSALADRISLEQSRNQDYSEWVAT